MLKNSVQNLVIMWKPFQIFLLSEEYYRWDLHCIFQTLVLHGIFFISMKKGSDLHEDLLPTCWIWAPQDPVTFRSREGNLPALAGPGISQRYKSPLEEETLQKIPPSPSSHTCTSLLPPLSCGREWGQSHLSIRHHAAMGMFWEYQPLHSHDFLKLCVPCGLQWLINQFYKKRTLFFKACPHKGIESNAQLIASHNNLDTYG